MRLVYLSRCAFDFCVCISFYFCFFFSCVHFHFIEIIFSLSCWFVLKRFTIQWSWVCWKEFVSFFFVVYALWMCVEQKGSRRYFESLLVNSWQNRFLLLLSPRQAWLQDDGKRRNDKSQLKYLNRYEKKKKKKKKWKKLYNNVIEFLVMNSSVKSKTSSIKS